MSTYTHMDEDMLDAVCTDRTDSQNGVALPKMVAVVHYSRLVPAYKNFLFN